MKKYLLNSLLLLLLSSSALAQNTLTLEGKQSPKAKLSDISWMAGHWRGEAFGGVTEEIWSPPLGDSMMGSFKLVSNGQVQFYEICQIREESETLIFRLKHFHGDLKGWEEKDDREEFKLVKVEENAVFFEGFTIKKTSKDRIVMHVVVGTEGGKSEEVEFKYSRFNPQK